MPYVDPSIADFKNYFVRDFPYGTTPDTVTDSDIAKAFSQTDFLINQDLANSQAQYTTLYLWLAAHYLVIDLRASAQGISGTYAWMETSKAVGNVSASYQIPQRILDNPELAMLTQTTYGAKFLSLILPQLTGQMFVVYGRTLP